MGDSPELPKWLALRRAGLGSTNFSLLLKRFGSIDAAWEAPADEVARAGLDAKFQRAFARARATYDPENELAMLRNFECRAYTWLDADFPEPLRDIPQSPPVLFVRGSCGPAFEQAVAVVGTRHVTPYGRQATEYFCEALARAGVAIISGLARGVDAIAHRIACEQGVPTVAALAGGIDKVYPRENEGLARRVMENGCLVSEYPAGIPARPDYFPRRNRIVSGLAKATLLIEAGEGSGALHTANWAFEQGRDVFAVPGNIFSRQSHGTNQLIRESTAKLVATPDQLCEELNLLGARAPQRPLPLPGIDPAVPTAGTVPPAARTAVPAPAVPPKPAISATPDEGKILQWLRDEPRHVDEIARASGLPVALVSSTLQVMELKGMVRQQRPLVYGIV